MLNSFKKVRLLKLINAIVFLLCGCIFLFFLVLGISICYYNDLDFSFILPLICLALYSILSFYSSAKCFIEYGMSKGVDYALEQTHGIKLD